MSVFTNRPAVRWLVPAAAAVTIIGGGAALGTLTATAEPSLPPRSAAQLLVDLQTARLEGLSGTVVQRADLGLPALTALGAAGGDLTALASGTHTARVWYAGPDKARIAVMDTRGETDVIRNGKDVWVWSSQRNEASHRVLRSHDDKPRAMPSGIPSTPQEAADQALAALDPTTEVTVGRAATIAGRDAYELVLTPRDPVSLVEQVRIAIDAGEHVPLRFEVFAEGTDRPAIEVAFTQVDFSRPDPQQFVFNPPAGAKVTEEQDRPTERRYADHRPDPQRAAAAKTVGTGWTTVLVARVPTGGDDREQVNALLADLPTVSGDWGSGRLLSTKLVSALLTDDGRVFVGAVRPDRLYEVARQNR
ncbi:MAG TPA: outer membrane lipoprotein carrier protein LolA [Micromonosporaceae bacterium]|nr:outer membrane lipoprotein carrier protein LolA [Micromonosporaceae bacterium]